MKQRKRTKRRILSVLLTLVMVFSTITEIVPGGVMTAKAEEAYNVWVGGTQVTSENAANIPVAEGNTQTGTASYNAETNTLTLDGFSCDGEKGKNFTISGVGSLEATIYSTEDLIINVASDSTITSPHDGNQNYSIFVAGTLTVQGSGKLYSVPYEGAYYHSLEGIHAETMDIKTGAGIYATNSKWNISVSNIIVEEGGTLSSNGNTMTAIGGRSGSASLVVNGTVIAGGDDVSWGMQVANITVNENGTVTTTGKDFGVYNSNKITINNGGKLTATAISKTGRGISSTYIYIKEGGKLAAFATNTEGGEYGKNNDARAIYNATLYNEIPGSGWDSTLLYGAGYEIPVGNGSVRFGTTSYSTYKIVKFPRHSHNFTYEVGTGANANTITAICDPDECSLPNGRATVSISAPQHKIYGDNKSVYASISDTNNIRGSARIVYYKATKNDDVYTKTGEALASAPTNAGDYVAEITLGDATARVGYTVSKKAGETIYDAIARNGIIIDYTEETVAPYEGYEISLDGENVVTPPAGLTDLFDSENEPIIYVRKAETENILASNWVGVSLTPRPAAPTLMTNNASSNTTADGSIRIINMRTSMEYSDDGGTTWTDVMSNPLYVIHGTYLVRSKAISYAPHGLSAEATVGVNYAALTEAEKPVIAVSGNHTPPVIGDKLTADTSATDVIYEWYRDDVKIEGEDKDTYTLTKDDAGKKITVKAIQTKKDDGTDYPETDRPSQTSDPTGEVVKKTPAILEQYVAKANVTISYPDETAIPTDGYEVSVDNKSETGTTKAISITSLIDETGTPTIYVRTKETDDTKAGEWVALTLTGRNDAPGPFSTEKRDAGKGTIAGMNDTMQYSADNGKTWTNATNESPIEVNSGNYLIRTKATDDIPASKSATLKVESNYDALTESNKPTISVSDDHNPPVIGDELTASTTATDILYEWYRDGEKIEGENKDTYTLTKDDAGKKITVKAIQTKKEDGTDYPENDRPSQASDPTGEVVKKTPPEISADTAKEGIVINYPDEAATPKDGYEVTTDKDSAEPSTPPLSLTEILDGEETPTIYVRTKETDENKAGEWVEVTLPARPDAPTGLNSESATSPRVNDGKIINTATTMEYKLKDSAEEWKAATDNETTGLAAGTYSVRYKATDADLHSKEATVTVGSKEIVLTDGEKPTAKADITYTGEAQELLDAPKDGLSEGATRIQYAIGTDDKTEPVDGWGDSVPIGTDAGIYYVWYKAIADAEHTDYIGGPIAVTIAPAEATVSNLPSASAITYGQKLSDSKLTGGDETGTFTWKTPETVPAVADSDKTEYEVIFTPKDTNYKAATCKVKVTVNKAAGKTPSADAVKTANASSVSASDGKLNFDGKNTYQYSADDGVTWTDVKDVTSVSVKAGTYKIRIAGDENNEPGEPITVKVSADTPVSGVSVKADTVKLEKAGATAQIEAKVTPDNATNKKLTYSSSDAKVATVDGNGKITAVANGSATITVKSADGNKTATVKVTVAIPETTKPVPESVSVVTPEEEEKATLAMNEGLKISQTKSKINISWGKVDTAAGYDVYVQYCGSNFKKEPTAGTNKTDVTKVTVNKINGKELNLKKNYKIYIEAYKLVDGKKVSLAKTITGHIVGRKNTAYTNVKMIKLAKSKYTVTAGKTATIKAKTVLVDKRKKQLSNAHATQFRYASSDNKIATVSKKGKIKGIAKGQCSVYVYARNGYARKITVTVK